MYSVGRIRSTHPKVVGPFFNAKIADYFPSHLYTCSLARTAATPNPQQRQNNAIRLQLLTDCAEYEEGVKASHDDAKAIAKRRSSRVIMIV